MQYAKTLAVIGGGAAGFFGAINAAEADPEIDINIFEKGNNFLSKVKISGVEDVMLPTHVLNRNYWCRIIPEVKRIIRSILYF